MMRTYTRKRPHHELIEDVQKLCRLCLNKAVEAIPIFTEDPNNICATIAMRIMICVGLEVKKEECLPNVICTKCFNELNKYYAFRKRCEVTYQKLKSHVLAYQENLYKQKLLKEAEQRKKVEEENENGLKFVVTFENDQFSEVNVLNLNGVAQVNNFSEVCSYDFDGKDDGQKCMEPGTLSNSNNFCMNGKGRFVDVSKAKQSDEWFVGSVQIVGIAKGIDRDLLAHPKLPEPTKVDSSVIEINVIAGTEQQSQDGETYSPDITAFLSTMLLELGILTQQEDSLVHSNQNIRSLELETGDGSQLMLELMEEDDVEEQVQEELVEEPQNTSKEVDESTQENQCIIKYFTPKPSNRRGRPKKLEKKGPGAWCPTCGKRLATSGALTRHLRTHSGERPYACATCGRRFAQKEVMLRHALVHEEERPHKCSACDKSFTQRGALVAHARAHAPPDARPLALHRCERCPKVFLYASGLSRHMMMHAGRVYVCGACERQFKDKSSLLRHLKNANHTTT